MIDPNSLLHDGVLSIIEDPPRIPRPTAIETRTRLTPFTRWAIARVSVLAYASGSSKTFFHTSPLVELIALALDLRILPCC